MSAMSKATRDSRVEALANAFAKHGLERFELAIVLGSGLGAFAAALGKAHTVSYVDIDGMARSSVAGHSGQFVIGEIGKCRVLVQQGRAHLYEGWSAQDATRAVRAFAKLGCRGVVLTNAAGGLRRDWKPGTLVRISDHINLQGRTPLHIVSESGSSRCGALLVAGYDAQSLASQVDRTAARRCTTPSPRGMSGCVLIF